MLREVLAQVVEGQSLSREQARQAMAHIMAGVAGESQIGALLTAYRMKGASGTEIAGFADAMRQACQTIRSDKADLIDTCGTGGDGKGTFNISTTVAFVLAGAGLNIAKHGNRGLSSACGSADVLGALGVAVDLPPAAVEQSITETGMGFLFAPVFHQAMRHAAGPRKQLGFRTVFNILGPLTNPAGAKRQLIGVYSRDVMHIMAEALVELGVERAMIVHSLDGMDEISTAAPTTIVEVQRGAISAYTIDALDYGFVRPDKGAYQGAGPEENALTMRQVLQGEQGPKRDIVLMNAAAALVVGGKAQDIAEGVSIAAASIDAGRAYAKLEELCRVTQRLAGIPA